MEQTIAAVATPNAAGGISVIRVSGEDAIAVCDRCFRSASGKRLAELEGYRALYGGVWAVSYTHLDVYKRQGKRRNPLVHERRKIALVCGHTGAISGICRRVHRKGLPAAMTGAYRR